MKRALRQAQLYGYLIQRGRNLYHPGGNHPVCSLALALRMVEDGWLVIEDDLYKLTREGLRAAN
jgi:hypothetical protein